jgi:hypothetical protein
MNNIKLTPGATKALFDIIDICGNGGNDRDMLEYYQRDLYTWFFTKDVIKKYGYTKESIGGYMSHLESIGFIALDSVEGDAVTIEGINFAINVLENQSIDLSEARSRRGFSPRFK